MPDIATAVTTFLAQNAAAIGAGTTVAKTGYDIVAGNTAMQEGKIAADEAADFQQEQYAEMLKGLGTQDKIVGADAFMSDPVLASILGGGDVQSLAELLADYNKGTTSSSGGLS